MINKYLEKQSENIEFNGETKVSLLISDFKKKFNITLRIFINLKQIKSDVELKKLTYFKDKSVIIKIEEDMKISEIYNIFEDIGIKVQVADKTDLFILPKKITLKEASKEINKIIE